MKLYLLKLKGQPPCFGCVTRLVIAAISPVHAREIANDHCRGEGRVWAQTHSASCEVLADATKVAKPGIIIYELV